MKQEEEDVGESDGVGEGGSAYGSGHGLGGGSDGGQEENGAQDDDDLLQQLMEAGPLREDVELKFFGALYEGLSGAKLMDVVKRHPNKGESLFVLKLTCAIFTFCRCDETGEELERCKDVMQIAFSKNTRELESNVLLEALLTWRELDKVPAASYEQFCDFCAKQLKFEPSSFAAARDQVKSSMKELLPDIAFFSAYIPETSPPPQQGGGRKNRN